MDRSSVSPEGFTAIELLVYVSAIALVLIFAVPFTKSSLQQSEVEQAMEIAEDSVKQARRSAMLLNTDVEMRIESDRAHDSDAITLVFPDLRRSAVLNEVQEEFALPEGVDIISSDAVIRFAPTGEVEWPATVLLVSQATADVGQQLRIE